MSKVKLNLSDFTPDQKSAFAADVVTKTSGITQFASIQPLTTALHDAQYPVGILVTAIEALREQIEIKVPQRDELIPALDVALEAHAAGVDTVAKGAKSVIETAGYEATADRQPPSPLGAVEQFSVSMGDAAGEVDWHCDALPRATSYEMEWTATPADNATWKGIALQYPTRSKGTLSGLPSGQVLTFRVRAVGGSTGRGEWSTLATSRVP